MQIDEIEIAVVNQEVSQWTAESDCPCLGTVGLGQHFDGDLQKMARMLRLKKQARENKSYTAAKKYSWMHARHQ